MCPASEVCYSFSCADFSVHRISVTLKITLKVLQYIYCGDGATCWLVIKEHGFIQRTMVHPIVTLVAGPLFGAFQYFYRCFVCLQVSFRSGVEQQLFIKRLEPPECFFCPTFQSR